MTEITAAVLSGAAVALSILAVAAAAGDERMSGREFAVVLIGAATSLIIAVLCLMETRREQRDHEARKLLITTLGAVAPPRDSPGGRQPALRAVAPRARR